MDIKPPELGNEGLQLNTTYMSCLQETMLVNAIQTDQAEVFDFLLQTNADLNAYGPNATTPIVAAICKNDHARVRRLLEHGASPETKNFKYRYCYGPLHQARDVEMIECS